MRSISSGSRRHIIVAALLLFVLVVISFSAVLHNGFVNWDDDAYLTDNPRVRDLSLASLPVFFTSLERIQYKPVSFLFFAIQYRLFGLDPLGYHAVSIVLHAVNALLVFGLFYLLRRNLFIAWGVAAFFAVHPLKSESVAWVTEQKDLLVGLFIFSSSIAYILYRERGSRAAYYLSLILFCLSLLAKPTAALAPFVLFGLDGLRRKSWRPLLDKVPFFAISFGAILINFLALRWMDLRDSLSWSPGIVFSRFAFYISKIFWPAPLSGYYPGGSEQAPAFLIMALAVVGVSAFLLKKTRLFREFFFGFSFFLLFLTPMLFLRGPIGVADRYVYIAGVGIFYVVLEFLATLKPGAGMIVLAAVVVVSASLSFERSLVWRNGVTLWSDVLKTYPRSELAHLNLVSAYYDRGDDVRARRHAQALLALAPQSWDGMLLLANVSLRQKDIQTAKQLYERVLRLNPASCGVYNGLGLVAAAQGPEGSPEAIAWFQKAVQINPTSFQSALNLAHAYVKSGKTTEAITWFRKAAGLKPDDIVTWQNLSVLLFEERRYGECRDALEHLAALEPHPVRPGN